MARLAGEIVGDGRAQGRIGDVVGRVGDDRAVAAGELVLPLSAGLDPGEVNVVNGQASFYGNIVVNGVSYAIPITSLGTGLTASQFTANTVNRCDNLKRGDIIAVVDTQKGAIEVEVFEDGVLESIAVQPGQTVPAVSRPAKQVATSCGCPAARAHCGPPA